MKYINKNFFYRCNNKDLGIKFPGSHEVKVVWNNIKYDFCRVKTITSLEHKRNGRYYYDFDALKKCRTGVITPYPIKTLKTEHWSGIDNRSILVKKEFLKVCLYRKKRHHL